MMFVSTRGRAPAIGLSTAIRNGVAPDGGLYLREKLPRADLPSLHGDMNLAEFAAAMLKPFFAGDPLAWVLATMCSEAFDFPVPLKTPDPARPSLRALELFHGPTGAFKDFGARFVMACMDRLGGRPTILVATSGDTGGAVGCAAEGRTGIRAVILYPRGRVSAFQQLQLGCWRAPALAVEVDGDFDDCQRLVKAALADPVLSKEHELTSANSINIGRLLPQIAYLGHAALNIYEETGIAPGMIIPTGNLGHAFAAIYARAMGLPIGPIIAVTNANRTLRDWAEKGIYEPRPAVATIANAMDVGAPSNFERLAALHPAQAAIHVELVGDGAIRERIRAEYDASSYVWCPHSATAAEAYARLPAEQKAERVWIAAATADPYKFADLVEPLIGRSIAPAPPLAAILEREARTVRIPATVEALAGVLRAAER